MSQWGGSLPRRDSVRPRPSRARADTGGIVTAPGRNEDDEDGHAIDIESIACGPLRFRKRTASSRT
jgi:hypothetical protein